VTAIQDIRESLEYSALFNLICILVPLGKIGASLYVLLSMNYPCFGVKHIWLVSMLFHDFLYAYIICIKLQIVVAMAQLESNNPNDPNANQGNNAHVAIEMGHPNQNAPAAENPHLRRQHSGTHAAEILAKRERVISLQSFCM